MKGLRITTTLALIALMLLGTVLLPARVSAQAPQDIDKMIATAKTASDHEAIAAYFDREAHEAAAKAEQHRKMAQAYGHPREGYAKEIKPLPAHCEQMAKRFDAISNEASELAKAHRKMAKKAQ